MGTIRVLPELIANKIAAGEVIERPASIVKELIENSLDAGGSALTLEIQHGGRALIRVSDDGCGMDRVDARTAFQRHATSKIACLEDLEGIGSYGFRGEALPSIAAVSRCRLFTRTPSGEVGTEVVMEGGALKGIQDHACRPGTIVEVRDLFFNTPARRKFLKAESTEIGHILDVVTHAALSAPRVRFTLSSEGKKLLDLLPTDRLAARLETLLGADSAGGFLEFEQEKNGVRLRGLLGKPSLNRSNRHHLQIFINRRWVKSLPLSYALQAGYQGYLMEGRYPVAVLFVELDLKRVDVNVHPAKQEVRISNEPEVTALIQQVVRECLRQSGELAPRLQLAAASTAPARSYRLNPSAPPAPGGGGAESWSVFDQPAIMTQTVPADAPGEPIALKGKIRITRLLGQLHQTFIVAQTEDGFVVVDQHAAHERIVYEQLLRNLQSDQPERQMMLLEELLELHPRQQEILRKALPLLEKVGFELELFGEGSWVIRSTPAALGEMNPVQMVHSFLDQVEEGKIRTALEEAREAVAALCACKKHSVKASDPLEPRAMRVLLERLAHCENPFHCPHGRPVFFTQTLSQLEKQFKRA